MKEELIAPCGMNCGVCSSYLAFFNDVKKQGIKMSYCAGCRPRDKKCAFLKKKCPQLLNREIQYCYECRDFPCDRLHQIDERYRIFYRMSMIENLEYIKKHSVGQLLDREKKKWRCPQCGGTVCCHNGICFKCGLG
ncbi:MAG: DUF3795 domain-containing protein, partial [Dehalococcoidales bacterium]|nr:DUF3795 domain-containing protein [Dehalococcoidales bacterium]